MTREELRTIVEGHIGNGKLEKALTALLTYVNNASNVSQDNDNSVLIQQGRLAIAKNERRNGLIDSSEYAQKQNEILHNITQLIGEMPSESSIESNMLIEYTSKISDYRPSPPISPFAKLLTVVVLLSLIVALVLLSFFLCCGGPNDTTTGDADDCIIQPKQRIGVLYTSVTNSKHYAILIEKILNDSLDTTKYSIETIPFDTANISISHQQLEDENYDLVIVNYNYKGIGDRTNATNVTSGRNNTITNFLGRIAKTKSGILVYNDVILGSAWSEERRKKIPNFCNTLKTIAIEGMIFSDDIKLSLLNAVKQMFPEQN